MSKQKNEIPNTVKRVDKLREGSNPEYEDPVYDLAKTEDEFRKDLADAGVKKPAADNLAGKFSDEAAEKMEANKEKWRDGLTGLRNIKAFKEEMPQLLSLHKRQNKDCALLMIDFDFFKNINDQYGHQAGDQALKKLTEIIKNQFRQADIVYRYGGEELVVFLSGATSESAAKLAEKVRQAVEKNKIEITDNTGQKQYLDRTISVGCAGTDQIKKWKDKSLEISDIFNILVNNADMAMYYSKKNGRNKATIYKQDLSKPENK